MTKHNIIDLAKIFLLFGLWSAFVLFANQSSTQNILFSLAMVGGIGFT